MFQFPFHLARRLALGALILSFPTSASAQEPSSPSVSTANVSSTNVSPTKAFYGPWKSVPIRGGGFLQQVFFAPSDANRMYLTSDVGGFWRSDDGGKSWRMLHGALPADAGSYSPRGFLVHPQNANRIWVATGSPWGSVNGVFASSDGGDSWTQTLRAPFDGNGNNRDGGNVLAMSPHNPDLLLAGSLGGGIHRSDDGGKTWQTGGPDDLNPTAIIWNRTDANQVWLSARNWPDRKFKRADGNEVPLRGGMFESNDGGKSWQEIAPDSAAPEELFQDPFDSKVLWGLRFPDKRVARSTDGGRTWLDASDGLTPETQGGPRRDGTYTSIAAGPDFLLLGSHGGHFYRLDRGETTWRKVEPKEVDEDLWWGRLQGNDTRHFGSALGFVGINPRNPKHWVFTDWYALYQSFDAGESWKLTLDGIEMTVLNTVAQDPNNGQIFHMGMADVGYFRTQNGGQTTEQVARAISNNIKSLATTPAQPNRVYATGTSDWEWKANAVFVSDDAGKSWNRSPMQGLPDMTERRCETIVASPSKPDEVWLAVSGDIKAGEGGPYQSLDGGKSWKWRGEGLPQSGGFFRSGYWVAGPELAISGDGSLVASSDNRGLLARREPNSPTWTMVPVPAGTPNCLSADALVPGRFYLALQGGGLWRSDDGGENWRNLIERDVRWITPDLKVKNRLAAVTPDGVLISLDAGATWRAMSDGLPYRHGRNVVCFAGESVVVGTGGNGVFVAPLNSIRGEAKSLAR